MGGREHLLFWARRAQVFFVLVPLAAALAGCITAESRNGIAPAQPGIVDQISEVDLSARHPRYSDSAAKATPSAGAQPASYYGDGTPPVVTPRPSSGAEVDLDKSPEITGAVTSGTDRNASNKGYDINFENTPIPTVAKTLLGDILGVGYAIDPRVQGTVSLASGHPVPKKDILFVLETALRVNNVALVREANGYRLIPSAEAAGTAPLDDTAGPEPGYGITVVPVQYVSAQTLTKLLDNFVAKPGMARADPSRNLVVIQGSAGDRRAALETIRSFDADWMRGQSVGIYPVSNSTPEPIIGELEKIVDAGEGGLSQNVVKLQAISRENAILVVTRKPELLKTVATWITRLDKSGGAGTGVKVYRMRYGDARQVAALLNDIFLGNSGSGLDSPLNQLVPGGGAVASSSARLGLPGAQQNGTSAAASSPIGTPPGTSATPASFNTRYGDASGGGLGQSSGAGGLNRAPDGRGGTPLSSVSSSGATTPLLANVRIAADVTNNALLIYANQENYRIIERTLQQIDRPQLQVAIDATIAEVTLNDNLSYGVQFYLQSKNLGLNPDTGSLLNQPFLPTTPSPPGVVGASAALSTVLPGFNFLAGSSAQPSMILNALHAITDVRVLSTPSLVVLDNQTASLQVGDQIPVTTGSATVLTTNNTVVNTIDYRNTGVILRVAPRVNVNGNVLLDIEQEISTVADTPTANTLTPTVSQRKVRSSIAVASGQTVLLAGLIGKTENRSRNGIPGLDQVPGLGVLFSQTSKTAQRTELIIFIRPQIIRNGFDARRVAEELRSKMVFRSGPLQTPAHKAPSIIK